jgi:hypothetical protein
MQTSNNNTDDIHIICPHCQGSVIVAPQDIQCAIFRHLSGPPGQINPHATRAECEAMLALNQPGQPLVALGCGKPFRYTPQAPGNAEPCEYI